MAAAALRLIGAAAALASAARAASAHDAVIAPMGAGGEPTHLGALAASPWSFEPWVVACLVVSAAGYALGLARLWRHAGAHRGIAPAQALAFALGWLALAAALVSPLDALGARSFAAHMVQHELLMVLAAPLLVLGRPLAAWAWALPRAASRRVGRAFHAPAWRLPWQALTGPLGAALVHAAVLWLWHLPAWFDAALAHAGLHALQHAAFVASALLFWWSVLGPAARAAQGAALASLFVTMLHTGALGALLALSAGPWYSAYALAGDALQDQQLGGIVMWMPAGLAYLAAALRLAARWAGLVKVA